MKNPFTRTAGAGEPGDQVVRLKNFPEIWTSAGNFFFSTSVPIPE